MTPELRGRVLALGKGNPGALRVLMDLLQARGPEAIDLVEAAGLTGPDIWVAYKDFAGENLETFIFALLLKDPDMMAAVQSERDAEAKWSAVRP